MIDLYTPRAVWLQSGMLKCPKCAKSVYRTCPQIGTVWMTCEHRRCDFEWWCVALPPMATRGHLALIVGEPGAESLVLRAAQTERYPVPAPWEPLFPGSLTQATYVCVAVRSRERHLYRERSPAGLIHQLGLRVPERERIFA